MATATAVAVVLLGLAAVSAALFPSSSFASTTVGADLSLSADSWQPTTLIAQRRVTDGSGASYSGFPSSGVLTSVSVKTRGAANTATVLILRKTVDLPAGAATFTNITAPLLFSVTEDPGAGTVFTHSTRIPVAAGDRFAMTMAAVGTWHLHWHSALETNYCFYRSAPHAEGESLDYLSTSCNNYIPLVQGVLEPDADADGYGDDTQDLCPSDASIQTACPVAAADLKLSVQRWSKRRDRRAPSRLYMATNYGPNDAPSITFSAKRARGLSKLTFRPSGGYTCAETTKLSCTIVGVPSGATPAVRVFAWGRKTFTVKLKMHVRASIADPHPGDESVTSNIRVRRLR